MRGDRCNIGGRGEETARWFPSLGLPPAMPIVAATGHHEPWQSPNDDLPPEGRANSFIISIGSCASKTMTANTWYQLYGLCLLDCGIAEDAKCGCATAVQEPRHSGQERAPHLGST